MMHGRIATSTHPDFNGFESCMVTKAQNANSPFTQFCYGTGRFADSGLDASLSVCEGGDDFEHALMLH